MLPVTRLCCDGRLREFDCGLLSCLLLLLLLLLLPSGMEGNSEWRNFPYTASRSVYIKVNKDVNISLQRVRVFAGTLRCKRQSSRPITFAPGVVKNILLDIRSQHALRVSG